MNKINQAVILAGGYGTRLKPFTDTNPKPMYPFEDKPFLEYLIEQIKDFGIKNVVLLLGYLPDKIMDYFGDGSKWGVNIQYSVTPVEFETGLRLKEAYSSGLLCEHFLLMYCDNYCPVNFNKLVREYWKNDAHMQLTAYANKDGYTKDNLIIDEDGRILVYDKTRKTENLAGVDIGYAIINRSVMELVSSENENFEKQVYPKLVEEGKLFATVTEHRYYSVGSWERIKLTENFFGGRKVIFLDRDGTLNVRPPKACYIESPDDFVWLPGAREAVKKLKENGYEIVLISNQPGIARGRLTEQALEDIHRKMQNELKEVGANIDHIYYCPHNWDEGCECRKPKPGMLFSAQKDLSIDLTKCWMIGDDERDMHAGGDAGCKCILVSEQHPLSEAVDFILKIDK